MTLPGRLLITVMIAVPVYLFRDSFTDFHQIATFSFTIASVLFPVMISTILMQDVDDIESKVWKTRFEDELARTRNGALIHYLIASLLTGATLLHATHTVEAILGSVAAGASVSSAVFSVVLGLFSLPRLRKQIRSRIRDDKREIQSRRFRNAG